MTHHIASTRMYLTVFACLMVLTALTVFVRLGMGIKSFTVAIAIAIAKATLVVLFFMHVKWSQTLSKLAVAVAVMFLVILLALTSTDYATRHWQQVTPGWEQPLADQPVAEPASAPAGH